MEEESDAEDPSYRVEGSNSDSEKSDVDDDDDDNASVQRYEDDASSEEEKDGGSASASRQIEEPESEDVDEFAESDEDDPVVGSSSALNIIKQAKNKSQLTDNPKAPLGPTPPAAKKDDALAPRQVVFLSPKGGPNRATEVVIPRSRMVYGQNAPSRAATQSDIEMWLSWKKAMNSFEDDFSNGALSHNSVMGVRFKDGEGASFVVLGFVAEVKDRLYFVPFSNNTAAFLVKAPPFSTPETAALIKNNQAEYDRAKKKPFADRTKLAKKIVDAVKAEPDTWVPTIKPKQPRKSSSSNARPSKEPKGEKRPAHAEQKEQASDRGKQKAAPLPEVAQAEDTSEEGAARKKQKVGGQRRVKPVAATEAKGMKQSTLVASAAARDEKDRPFVGNEEDVAMLPAAPAGELCGQNTQDKHGTAGSSGSEATCAAERSPKRTKMAASNQHPSVWSVPFPRGLYANEADSSCCEVEWKDGQCGMLRFAVTQHFSVRIPEGCEIAKSGRLVHTKAVSLPALKIPVRSLEE